MTETKTDIQRIEALEEATGALLDLVEGLTKGLATVASSAVTKPKGLFGGKRTKTAILDTKTKVVHASKSALGKAIYEEIENGDPADRFIWYKLLTKFPERFTELADDDPKAVACWEAEKAATVAAQAEAQTRLDKEASDKAAADKAAVDKAASDKTTKK